jgi:hypothetical protein
VLIPITVAAVNNVKKLGGYISNHAFDLNELRSHQECVSSQTVKRFPALPQPVEDFVVPTIVYY